MKTRFRSFLGIVVTPILAVLYVVAYISLLLSNVCHLVVYSMDWLFDWVAALTEPLPNVSNSSLPLSEDENDD